MEQFVKGETQSLVATTVIEVGVNVPHASVMVILDAQRFGLSQLHQLRGRVGRGCDQSYCILVTNYKLSEETRKRIDIMCDTNDGFRIAEADLKLRGPGDLEGTQQSGKKIIKEDSGHPRKYNHKIFPHQRRHLGRRLQYPYDPVQSKIDNDIQKDRHPTEKRKGCENPFLQAMTVPLSEPNGKHGPAPHGKSQQDRSEEGHQGKGRAYRRQGVRAEEMSDNDRICNVIALLQKIS